MIFDLDNTLYDETQFVRSGFRAVSRHMTEKHKLDEESFYNLLLSVFLEHGRDNVFDTTLKTFNICNKKIVSEMVKAYRNHFPNITLFSDVPEILPHIKREYQTALLTDGVKRVQENKVEALKIRDLFDVVTYAVEYGGKRSPKAFLATSKKLKVDPAESVYVDDNPLKAFAVANQLGFHTVRILRGEHKNLKIVDESCRPSFEILNLRQLPRVICLIQDSARSNST